MNDFKVLLKIILVTLLYTYLVDFKSNQFLLLSRLLFIIFSSESPPPPPQKKIKLFFFPIFRFFKPFLNVVNSTCFFVSIGSLKNNIYILEGALDPCMRGPVHLLTKAFFLDFWKQINYCNFMGGSVLTSHDEFFTHLEAI